MTTASSISNPPSSALRPRMTYDDWIAAYDAPSGLDFELRRRLRSLPRHPQISILLPVYNPKLDFLAKAIASVRAQIYPNWQLCMADDASTDAHVRPFLEQLAGTDSRIALAFRKENGHIAAASNSALALATGTWCALLDQDDVLPAHALALVAREINAHPDAGLIYSDEDKISEHEVRSDPFFKPDWNPELFLAQNYINHLGVYRADVLRDLGGFREGFAGSQDYDLALRFIEVLRPEQVRHIPRILYHWRAIPGSVAASITAKPYATHAARRAIAEHLRRRGIRARVEACEENAERHRVIYDLPLEAPLVSVILVKHDGANSLQRLLDDVRRRTDYERIEFVVVPDGIGRESGIAGLLNRGAAAAKGECLLFLHAGIEIDEGGWLREMVGHALQPDVGAVGARLWSGDGTLQDGGMILGLGGVAGCAFEGTQRGHPGYFDRAILQQDCSAITDRCMLVRKTVFENAGGFDEANFPDCLHEIDFCLRLRAKGLRIVWTPYSNLTYRGDARTRCVRAVARLQQNWGGPLVRDPFYSPNFSLQFPGFGIAFPPRRSEYLS